MELAIPIVIFYDSPPLASALVSLLCNVSDARTFPTLNVLKAQRNLIREIIVKPSDVNYQGSQHVILEQNCLNPERLLHEQGYQPFNFQTIYRIAHGHATHIL